jgi:hypothetical protein
MIFEHFQLKNLIIKDLFIFHSEISDFKWINLLNFIAYEIYFRFIFILLDAFDYFLNVWFINTFRTMLNKFTISFLIINCIHVMNWIYILIFCSCQLLKWCFISKLLNTWIISFLSNIIRSISIVKKDMDKC